MHDTLAQVQQDVSEIKENKIQRKHVVDARRTIRPQRKARRSRIAQIEEHLPADFQTWPPQEQAAWLRSEKNHLDLLSVRVYQRLVVAFLLTHMAFSPM